MSVNRNGRSPPGQQQFTSTPFKSQDATAFSAPSVLPDAPITRIELWSTHLSKDMANTLCGATGGLASGIVTCPLDVIKTKLQAQGAWQSQPGRGPVTMAYQGMVGTTRIIWREEGIRGMYRGLTPMILGYLPTWAVWFTVYDRARTFWYKKVGQEREREKAVAHLLASLTAGATSTMVTNPIWVIKTRLMSQVSALSSWEGPRPQWHYTSTWDAARKMYKTEGLRSFYSGLSPALLGLSHVAVQFPLYEYFRMKFTGRPMGYQSKVGEDSQWLGIFTASVLSKLCASSATYPHEVLRTRLQTQQRSVPFASPEGVAFRGGFNGRHGHAAPVGASSSDGMRSPPRYKGIVKTFKTILKEEGWRAFYAGLGTNLFRAVPAAVTTMITFEYSMGKVKHLQAEGRRKLELAENVPQC